MLWHFSLEQQFQSELDLPRIVGRIASGSDLAESLVQKVLRPGDGHNAVAAKSRTVEVRMIENVKELRPELQVETLAEMEILGSGEIQSVEPWSINLRGMATQGGKAG